MIIIAWELLALRLFGGRGGMESGKQQWNLPGYTETNPPKSGCIGTLSNPPSILQFFSLMMHSIQSNWQFDIKRVASFLLLPSLPKKKH